VTSIPSRRGIQPHDTITGQQQPRVNSEIRRGARIRLHVHPPALGVETERVQRAFATERFDFVDVLITTVISRTGHSFRVLIRQVASQRLHHSPAHEILGRYEFNPTKLPLLLLFHYLVDVGVRD